MKKLFLFLILFLASIQLSYAADLKYAVHTSSKDIEFKKKKALDWHENNLNSKRYNWYESNTKNTAWLKDRVLRWYENNVTKGKFYFVKADAELSHKQSKALKWYERNSSQPSAKKSSS